MACPLSLALLESGDQCYITSMSQSKNNVHDPSGKLCHMLSVTLMIRWPHYGRIGITTENLCITRTCQVFECSFYHLQPIIHLCRKKKKKHALAGNRTQIYCLEGSNAYHYTTNALLKYYITDEALNDNINIGHTLSQNKWCHWTALI